jgi:hypothetical protein
LECRIVRRRRRSQRQRTGDVGCAGSEQPGFGAVGAAKAKIDKLLSRCGQNDAGCLGGDEGLEMQKVD